MVPPRVEIRRYTAHRTDSAYSTILPAPITHADIMQARQAFPSLDTMTLLELEADRDDH